MKIRHALPLLTLALVALGTTFAVGCEEEPEPGTFEELGRDLDEATQETRERLEDAGDELGEAAEELGDEAEETGDRLREDLEGDGE